MKKYILPLLLFGITIFGIIIFAHAEDATPHTQKTALWKVTSAHRTMYITGSLGASLKKYPIPAAITKAFSNSGELIMEGKTSMSKKENVALMKKYAHQPSGKELDDDLDASQLKLVKKAFLDLSVVPTLADLQPYQPWVAVMVLKQAVHKALNPHVKPHEMPVYFHNKANDRNMPVTFLNTNASEIRLYASMPQAAWLTLVAKTTTALKSKPRQQRKREGSRMLHSWRNGDTEPIYKFYKKSYQDDPRIYDILVTSYEARWLKSLEAALNEDATPVFVIVNADNLVGPVNILNGLKKAGYHVSQL